MKQLRHAWMYLFGGHSAVSRRQSRPERVGVGEPVYRRGSGRASPSNLRGSISIGALKTGPQPCHLFPPPPSPPLPI